MEPDWAYLIFASILSLGNGPVRTPEYIPCVNATTFLSYVLDMGIDKLRLRLLSCLGNMLIPCMLGSPFYMHAAHSAFDKLHLELLLQPTSPLQLVAFQMQERCVYF